MEENEQKQVPKLKSHLGTILVSAGASIGLGNIWKFPIVVSRNGGGIFLLFYLIFVLIFGIPLITAELSLGRKSQETYINVFRGIDKKKARFFNWQGFSGHISTIIINMFYVVVTSWIIIYFFKSATGVFSAGITEEESGAIFQTVTSNPWPIIFCSLGIVAIGFLVCAFKISKVLENVNKFLMIGLFIMLIVLVIVSCTLPGAGAGVLFFIKPDFSIITDAGVFFKIIFNALSQCFYSLSIGSAIVAVLGSYTSKNRTLLGTAAQIAGLDTLVAILAGFIIFPAASAFGMNLTKMADGPDLLFKVMPMLFSHMPVGALWGSLFFICLTFASMSTLFVVYESIVSCMGSYTKLKKWQNCLIGGVMCFILTIPPILGFNVWSPVRIGKFGIFEMCDWVAGNVFLPIGALTISIFITSEKLGMGFNSFIEEANLGRGIKFPAWSKWYMKIVVPVFIFAIFVIGMVSTFVNF